MDCFSSSLSSYVNQINQVGSDLGPMVVRGLVLLIILLVMVKYLGRSLGALLIKMGLPERRAAYSVTALHILVLWLGALVILYMVGFPGALLFRVTMVILMIVVASFIIVKPYIPQLPLKTGDIVQIGGAVGKVDLITIMSTRIRTFDGKVVYIPNHKVLNDQVVNTSARPNRRLDIDFFLGYDQDVNQARTVVADILKESDIVLEKPAPRVVIDKFSPGYMEMKARFWVERKHALTGRWGINEKIKSGFDEKGIQMASPRLEIDTVSMAAPQPVTADISPEA